MLNEAEKYLLYIFDKLNKEAEQREKSEKESK